MIQVLHFTFIVLSNLYNDFGNETEPDLGAHTFNAGTWESEQAELRFQGQPGLHNEFRSSRSAAATW